MVRAVGMCLLLAGALPSLAPPAHAEPEEITWLVSLGGSFDLPLARSDWLSRVGPALRMQAGVLVRGDGEDAGQVPFFVRYAVQSTTFDLGGTEPDDRLRHDIGIGFGYLGASSPLSPGFLWISDLRIAGDSMSLGQELGPALRINGPGPSALWLTALASPALNFYGEARSDTFGVNLGAHVAGELAL